MSGNEEILNQLSADQRKVAENAKAPVAEPAAEKPAAAPKPQRGAPAPVAEK